jgi:anti-anti-sigma regulatory factor
MPTELRHLIDDGQPYPVVRLIGPLDADAAPRARAALLDGLVEQPEALVVDVSAVDVTDPAAVGVFADIARDTADWPAARLVICAPGGDGVWQSSGLPVWPSLAAAFTALGPPEPGNRLSLELDPVVGAARRARGLVVEACERWHLPDLIGPASIVVTEMVNNVVAHARTPMAVRMALHGGDLTVSVRDHDAKVPRFQGPVPPTSYGGRGLLLINAVSRQWGALRLDDGKVVWALIHRPGDALATAAPAEAAGTEHA